MNKQGQISPVLARKKQMIVSLLDNLCQQFVITDTQFKTAETRYEAVSQWLSASSSPHLNQVQIYPQGSIALGTAIKPLAKNEFDVDLVCHLPNIRSTLSAQAVKKLVGDRLKEHATYKGMLEEKRRCWRINYANEFHLDITPSILNPNCQQKGELVPDKTLAHWKPTNPKGYIKRFEHYATLEPNFLNLERIFAEANYDNIDPLPEPSMTKPLLKRIVQLLKRHRDQRFVGNSHEDRAPISVIITTLAGWAYTKCAKQHTYTNEFDFIVAVIKEMPTFIRVSLQAGKPLYMIENETTAGENFADKWNQDPKLPEAFSMWHVDVLNTVNSLLLIEGIDQFAEKLSLKFGGKKDVVREMLSRMNSPIAQARSAGQLSIAPSIGLTASPSQSSVIVPKNTFYGY